MKRYPIFAVAVLLFLLLFLLGSWVYLDNFPWPLKGGGTEDVAEADDASDAARDTFADREGSEDEGEGSDHGGRTNGPLEVPPDGFRRGIPPASVDVGDRGRGTGTVATPKDTIVTSLTPGLAAIRDQHGRTVELDPYIVSTLRPPVIRANRMLADIVDADVEKLIAQAEAPAVAIPLPELGGGVLEGEVVWPSLTKSVVSELQKEYRYQAIVYLDKLPEFRAVVDAKTTKFKLPLTEKVASDFRASGVRLVVHSPAFEISGGYEALTAKQHDGPIKISLQPAPLINVTVDVGPAEAITHGVRVWVERRGLPGTPDHDDSLYMSAAVPSSGRLHFIVPEHYGELRIAATGLGWHSGLPQLVSLRDWKTAKVSVTLNLAEDRCDLVQGDVKQGGTYSNSPVRGARLESTHFGAVVYTDDSGSYKMYVPSETTRNPRQFIVTAAWLRPEVIALEASGTSSPGVTGGGGGFGHTAVMANAMSLELELPKDVRAAAYRVLELAAIEMHVPSKGRVTAKVPWDSLYLTLVDEESKSAVVIWISAREWERAFKAYIAGTEASLRLEAQSLADAFKKR